MNLNGNTNKMTKNLNVFWTKAEKELCKRSKSINSLVKSNTTHEPQISQLTSINYQTINNNNNNKISFKDLCDEDKARIANLVKEIAKLGAEKDEITKLLDQERNRFDEKSNDFTNQQKALIEEKELLLKKLVETQDRLTEINNRRIENIDLIKKRTKKRDKELKVLKIPSSTPQNSTSPRCLSPIIDTYAAASCNNQQNDRHKREFTKRIDEEIMKIKNHADDDDDGSCNTNPILHSTLIKPVMTVVKENKIQQQSHEIKRQQLFKQHIELIDEQNQLKKLLEQQELLLKEKHNQIMLQQQMHRERLNQLTFETPKSTNIDNQNMQVPIQDIQNVQYHQQQQQNKSDVATSPIRTTVIQKPTAIQNKLNNNNNNKFIEKYDSNISLLSMDFGINDHINDQVNVNTKNTSLNTTKQENNFLFELIFNNNNNHDQEKHVRSNATAPHKPQYNLFNRNCNNGAVKHCDNDDDSKLIEEIFFLN